MKLLVEEHEIQIDGYSVSASGDVEYPFCVCAVGGGVDVEIIANFVNHADAVSFVSVKSFLAGLHPATRKGEA